VKRSINFSGRNELLESSITAKVVEVERDFIGKVEIDFSDIAVPRECTLVLEFFHNGEQIRKNFEGPFEGLWKGDANLSTLRSLRALKLRVKIFDLVDGGIKRILFVRDNIHIEGVDSISNSDSLLKIRKEASLKNPWNLVWEDDEPVLLVTDANTNAEEIYHSTHFQIFVLPGVLKQVLKWAYGQNQDDSETEISKAWVVFAEKLHEKFESAENESDELNDHIDAVVNKFIDAHGIMSSLKRLYGEEVNQSEN
jgi:hypothetical protein